MRQMTCPVSWRARFIQALRLLGEAVARLPFGAREPVLCGAAAIELYTGGLWPAAELELLAADARPVTAELFAGGFRWAERSGGRGKGLWHPDLEVAVDVVETLPALNQAEQANALTVMLDLNVSPRTHGAVPSVKVIGIEDLLTELVALWATRSASPPDITTCVHALYTLARRGVGGRLRTAYLQCRLDRETQGEVVIEELSDVGRYDPAPRTVTLTQMQAVIAGWGAQCGLTFALTDPNGGGYVRTSPAPNRNKRRGRAEQRCGGPANVVPFDAAWAVSAQSGPPGASSQ